MDKLDSTIVIIDDDKALNNPDSGLMIELNMNFESIRFFYNQEDGLEFIENNLDKRLIVLLDLGFPSGTPSGHEILESIREVSFLIPVLIWSGVDEDKESFADLINNRAYAFLNKNASTEEIIEKLKEAYNYADNDISIALEEWINAHSDEQKQKPYLLNVDGRQLSLNELLNEIRMQSNTGKYFSKNLAKLTIDLLTRNKEKLDD
ncbi:MAG: response regulator [Bacteroidales bacterium]|nr:response regulator [Bacteroidales bacterium]